MTTLVGLVAVEPADVLPLAIHVADTFAERPRVHLAERSSDLVAGISGMHFEGHVRMLSEWMSHARSSIVKDIGKLEDLLTPSGPPKPREPFVRLRD